MTKSDDEFAAMLDGFYHSGGHVTQPAPLIVNTMDDAREMIERYHIAFPRMGSRENPLVLHITVEDEVSPSLRRVASIFRDEVDDYRRWSDPAADPLAEIQAFITTMKPPPMTLTMTRRMQCKIARRTMSKRAYRRWRGRTR